MTEKTVVVFGCGSVGVPGSEHWPVKHQTRYICFDPEFKRNPPKIRHPQVEFRSDSAAHTQLPDGCAEEVHMHNLISDNPETFEQREAIVREAARILKRGGALHSLNDQLSIRVTPQDFNRWAWRLGLSMQIRFENSEVEGTPPRRLTQAEKSLFYEVLGLTPHVHRAELTFHPKASLVSLTKI